MKQNPFSLYDFLGYFIPGMALIFAGNIIPACKVLNPISIEGILKSLPSLTLEGITLVIIISYSLGHVLSFISSITVEKYSAWRYGYPSRYLLNMKVSNFSNHFRTFHGFFWGSVIVLLLLPTCVLDFIFGKFFGFRNFYVRNLDKMLIKIITIKINVLVAKLGMTKQNGFKENEGNNSDFFRIIQHYTFENSIHHQSKFTNYIALFGFLRTMTLIMNLLFWYLIGHFILISEFDSISAISLIIVSGLAYVFFMAFMKFYRRYTLEGFMVLIADKNIQ